MNKSEQRPAIRNRRPAPGGKDRKSGKKRIRKALLVLLSLLLVSILPAPSSAAGKTEAASKDRAGKTASDTSVIGLSPEQILKKMSLEQKIAQMLLPSVRDEDNGGQDLTELTDPAREAIRKHSFCGYLFFDQNCQNAEQIIGLTSSMQRTAVGSDADLQIPLLLTVDQEGGRINRIGFGTPTPGNLALGATWDSSCAEEEAEIIGSEIASLGFNLDYAPVMDLNTEPASDLIALRSFGQDPEAAGKMGAAFVKGLHKSEVAACMKHFPGHGDTETDSHADLPVIRKNLKQLKKNELIPFREGIDSGADMIMTAHIQYPEIEKDTYTSISTGAEISLPATLSDDILTGLLREEMGYDGVIISDALKMKAIASHFDLLDATELAINAGVDIIMNPGDITTEAHVQKLDEYIGQIAERVKKGSIKEKTIDEAVLRILRMKEERGLLDKAPSWQKMKDGDTAALVSEAEKTIGSDEHRKQIQEITDASTTLLKNENSALPVSRGKTVILCPEQALVSSVSSTVEQLKKEGRIDSSETVAVVGYGGLGPAYASWNVSGYDNVIGVSVSQSAGSIGRSARDSFLSAALKAAHQNGSRFILISAFLPYDAAAFQEADAIMLTYGCRSATEIPQDQKGEVPDYGPALTEAVRAAFDAFTPSGHLSVDIPKMDASLAMTEEILYPSGFGMQNWTQEDTVEKASQSGPVKSGKKPSDDSSRSEKKESSGSKKDSGGEISSIPLKCCFTVIMLLNYML